MLWNISLLAPVRRYFYQNFRDILYGHRSNWPSYLSYLRTYLEYLSRIFRYTQGVSTERRFKMFMIRDIDSILIVYRIAALPSQPGACVEHLYASKPLPSPFFFAPSSVWALIRGCLADLRNCNPQNSTISGISTAHTFFYLAYTLFLFSLSNQCFFFLFPDFFCLLSNCVRLLRRAAIASGGQNTIKKSKKQTQG